MENNPFNVSFGVKADNYINGVKKFNEITQYFDRPQECGKAYIILGIRGNGKTIMLIRIQQ